MRPVRSKPARMYSEDRPQGTAPGVLVLRVKEPGRPRPFKVPFIWVIAPLGMAACLFVMVGLPRQAWERFGIWLVIGAAIYLLYGHRHSRLRLRRDRVE